jgi:hypothetical protein
MSVRKKTLYMTCLYAFRFHFPVRRRRLAAARLAAQPVTDILYCYRTITYRVQHNGLPIGASRFIGVPKTREGLTYFYRKRFHTIIYLY